MSDLTSVKRGAARRATGVYIRDAAVNSANGARVAWVRWVARGSKMGGNKQRNGWRGCSGNGAESGRPVGENTD